MSEERHELTLAEGRTLWTISKVVTHLGIGKATFTSYVSKGIAPAPAIHIERTRLWDADEIRAWHAARPGSPVRNAPRAKGR
ncbi:helix-turn-helix transcriptional regulator [Corynebacterium lizhenjunii]|uniref:helix-turn-helix transcriptional regulator n=1 Tax=Corynebacterium lizhenjunii TaxID=2709394 RepID=UPI0013ECB50E|nr:hypothetical protein [Corynebacterium lizhenjunii]